jgi:translation initiation factor RLI1
MFGLAGAATVTAGRVHTPKVTKNNAMREGEEQFMGSVIDSENTRFRARSAVIFAPRQQERPARPPQPR